MSRLASSDDHALRRCLEAENTEAALWVQSCGPLLFALAVRFPLLDVEAAVCAVLHDLQAHPQAWIRSGLPARVWITGMAVRRFRQLCDQVPGQPPEAA